MNVLHVHGNDIGMGRGASLSTLLLHDGLRKAGVDSRMLCPTPTRTDSVAIPRTRGEGWLGALTSRLGLNDLHSLGTFRIQTLAAYHEADLLHLHSLHGGFFNSLALPQLTKTKPAIYTLHDMWPFTGHCVHSFDCERWKNGCGRCPYPEMPNAIQRDATSVEWRLKDWSYRRSNLTIVAPSTWMYELAKQSMLSHLPIHHIPHGVDTDLYQPLDPEMSRSALGIPTRMKVLLYVVRRMNLSDTVAWMKGADLLVRALQDLPASIRREALLLLVGNGGEDLGRELDMPTVSLGFVSGDRLKALAFSAADLFVFPSRADNFPRVLLESMACGTPTVAFRVGGVPDLIRPGVTGFLAEPEDHKQLTASILQLLEDTNLRAHLSRQCRAIAVKEYPLDLYVDRHIALYRDTVSSGPA